MNIRPRGNFYYCCDTGGFISGFITDYFLSLFLLVCPFVGFSVCLSVTVSSSPPNPRFRSLSFSHSLFLFLAYAVCCWEMIYRKIDELINLCFVLGKQSNKEPLINVKMVCLKLGLKWKSINKGNKQNLNVLMVTINHTNAETKYSYNWNNGKSYDSVNKMTLCMGQFNKKTGILTQIYSEYML